MITERAYTKHRVFEQLIKYSNFYRNLASSIMQFVSMGTSSVLNIDTYVYTSMQGTIRIPLEKFYYMSA